MQQTYIRDASRLLFRLALIPLYIFSAAVPKADRVWIFGAFHGKQYSGSSKHLYKYVCENVRDVSAIWITRSSQAKAEVVADGGRAHHVYSLMGLYLQLRAGVSFFTHAGSADFFTPIVAGKTLKYQLWHGSPIKKILHDDRTNIRASSSIYARLVEFLFPWRSWRFDAILSPTADVAPSFSTAFQSTNIVIIGSPRNDRVARGIPTTNPQRIRRILYAPTFRGEMFTADGEKSVDATLLGSGFDVTKMDEFLHDFGAHLDLRLHPVSRLPDDVEQALSNSSHITTNYDPDIYISLDRYDVLISDYSSIIFDFMLTGNPVIQMSFDLEEYLISSREMYYDFSDIALTPKVKTWSHVCRLLHEMSETGLTEEYIAKYLRICGFFNGRNPSTCASREVILDVERRLQMRA